MKIHSQGKSPVCRLSPFIDTGGGIIPKSPVFNDGSRSNEDSIKIRSMKIFKIILFSIVFLSFFVFVNSCKKEESQDFSKDSVFSFRQRIDSVSIFGNNFIVPMEIATEIAQKLNFSGIEGNLTGNDFHIIQSQFIIRDSADLPVLYIFNYQNGGMSVLSADERLEPICAVVPAGKYESVDIPSALLDWFDVTIKIIELLRKGEIDNTVRAKDMWIDVLSEVNENYRMGFINCCEECLNYPECLIDPELGCGDVNVFCDPCGPWQTVTVGPLLTTRWGQRCTYNEQCPDEGCFNRCLLPNPNALTGCVATAIAQVLRYWAHPSSHGYNYLSMPDFSGNAEVQRMMADIGQSVNMNYGCDASGALAFKIPGSFKHTYNYGSAKRSNYSFQRAIDNLNARRPVILDGCRTRTDWGLFYTYSNCHAWVCDGYQKYSNKCHSYLFFHMNWGWDGRGNGWFAMSNWSNPNWNSLLGNYQYFQNMSYDIIP